MIIVIFNKDTIYTASLMPLRATKWWNSFKHNSDFLLFKIIQCKVSVFWSIFAWSQLKWALNQLDFNNVINSGSQYNLIKVAPVFPGLKCNLHGDHV